jgi:hypothetical protein
MSMGIRGMLGVAATVFLFACSSSSGGGIQPHELPGDTAARGVRQLHQQLVRESAQHGQQRVRRLLRLRVPAQRGRGQPVVHAELELLIDPVHGHEQLLDVRQRVRQFGDGDDVALSYWRVAVSE